MKFHFSHRQCLNAILIILATAWLMITLRSGAAEKTHDNTINIAPLAEITSDFEVHAETLRNLADDDPGTEFDFAEETEGDGSVTFHFNDTREVEKIRLLQSNKAYYSQHYRVLADKNGTGKFEVILVENKSAKIGEWNEHVFPGVGVKAIRFQSLSGISEGARAHPCIAEFQIYGTEKPQDFAAQTKMGLPVKRIGELKPMCLETTLVKEGKATCSILVPDDRRYLALGKQIAKNIQQKTGGKPRVYSNMKDVDPARETVIALGQMLNNKLIGRLYWNHYVILNSLCPGKQGWIIQTVHNPYPWVGGKNIVVLGASTFEGAQQVVDEFEKLLPSDKTIVLPYTLKSRLPPPSERPVDYHLIQKEYSTANYPAHDLTDEEIQNLAINKGKTKLVSFQELAIKYLVSGETPYIKAARQVLEDAATAWEENATQTPEWPEECNSQTIFALWDAVEEAPIFSDADRLRYTNMFLNFWYGLTGRIAEDDGRLEKGTEILYNHTTFPLLGCYFGARYFRNYYGAVYMDKYLKKATSAFRGQETSWKPQEDSSPYLPLVMGHTIDYGLAENRFNMFESGIVRRYADYVIGICDNRGWAAGFGDSGNITDTSVPDASIPIAFWYYNDPGYLWYLNSIHDGHWPNPYHQDITPVPPANTTGIRTFPLTKQVYDYTKHRSYDVDVSGPPNIPFKQSFDKIAFRSGTKSDDQYFLLDGYSRGKHLHYDGNAIIQLSDKGEKWLVSDDYLVRNTTDQNMLSVIRNGRCDNFIPECAALLHSADFQKYGFTETMIRDYNGVDWYRDIFWQKGGWVVVLDRIKARSNGDYKFDCIWKTTDRGSEELVNGRTFRITRRLKQESPGSFRNFYIVNSGDLSNTMHRRARVFKYFTQRQSKQMCDGDRVGFANLLYLDDVGEHKNYDLESLTDSVVIAKLDQDVLLGCGKFEKNGLKIDAALFFITKDSTRLVDATQLSFENISFTSTEPVSLEMDFVKHKAIFCGSQPVEVKLNGHPVLLSPDHPEVPLDGNEPFDKALPLLADHEKHITKNAASPILSSGIKEVWYLDAAEGSDGIVRDVSVTEGGNRLVCRGKKLECYAGDGKPQWSFTAEKPLRCVATGRLRISDPELIFCGGQDEQVHMLDLSGREQAHWQITQKAVKGQGNCEKPYINCIAVDDLNGDGQSEILVGTDHSQINAFDSNLNLLWNQDGIYHGAGRILTADIYHDGKKEVLVSDHYGYVHMLSSDGQKHLTTYSEIGDVVFDVADLTGNGKLDIVNGSSSGAIAAFITGKPFESLPPTWRFNNFGYANRGIIGLQNTGLPEILVGSETGYIYSLDNTGKVLWQKDLGSAILCMTKCKSQQNASDCIIAGQRDGSIVVLGSAGKIQANHKLPASTKLLKTWKLNSEDGNYIFAVDENNRCSLLLLQR